jgi:CRP-like cAMP-binding protein
MTAPSPAALSLFLHRLLLRSTLSAEEREAILALPGTPATVPARTDIVAPGQRVGYACLVVEGLAGRFDQMADGRRQTVSFYLPGDMCDLPSVVLPIAAWGITALTTSTILLLPHAALRDVAARYPAIAMAFWRDTVVDAATLAKWVANIGRKEAMARLAHLFCELGERMAVASLGTRTRFRLPINQEQLADATGLTSVHVNRTLRALREAGILAYRNQLVEVLDLPRLASIAEFDDRFLLLDDQEFDAG